MVFRAVWRKGTAVAVAAVIVLAVWPLAALAGFDDYTDLAMYWARDAIKTLYDAGALDDPPPLYRPDAPIARGQFSRYLSVGWGIIEVQQGSQQEEMGEPEVYFVDVTSDNQYITYVNTVYRCSIMIGSGGVFGVDDYLTREQAATVMVRAAGREPHALARSQEAAEALCSGAWRDASSISSWAVQYLAEAYDQGLFRGDPSGTLRPLDNLSKAEAATIIVRIKGLAEPPVVGQAPGGGDIGGQPVELGSAPALPAVMPGVESIFTVTQASDGRVWMKVYITGRGSTGIYDLEIYPAHQRLTQAVFTPLSGPAGWSPTSGTAGIGWYGDTPLVPGQCYAFEFYHTPSPGDTISFVLTDQDHNPIGSATSQRVYGGAFTVADGMATDFGSALRTGDPVYYESAYDPSADIFFSLTGGMRGEEPSAAVLIANSEASGGIYYLGTDQAAVEGLLDPGGILPDPTSGLYVGQADAVAGGYYAVCDHTGSGFALLFLESYGPSGCSMQGQFCPGSKLAITPINLPYPVE